VSQQWNALSTARFAIEDLVAVVVLDVQLVEFIILRKLRAIDGHGGLTEGGTSLEESVLAQHSGLDTAAALAHEHVEHPVEGIVAMQD